MSREVDRQHSAGHAIARAKSDRRVYLFQYACDTLVGVETEVQCLQSARLSHPHLHCDLVVAQPASDCRALHRWVIPPHAGWTLGTAYHMPASYLHLHFHRSIARFERIQTPVFFLGLQMKR